MLRLIVLLFIIASTSMYSLFANAATTHHTAQKSSPQTVKHKHHKKKSQKHYQRHYVPATHADMSEADSSFHFFGSSMMEARLVQFVQNSLENLHYSVYKPGGAHFDERRGVYIADCSGYVDHVLQEVHPLAYSSLTYSMEVDKPNTRDYYDFFSDLDERDDYWEKVSDIEKLRPGDILVIRYKNTHGHETGGHVMVVMDKPVRDLDSYMVRVADSAAGGHSEDTRLPHVSGIGMGLMRLKADPNTGKPLAIAWRLGSRWLNNVKIAMARPTDQTN